MEWLNPETRRYLGGQNETREQRWTTSDVEGKPDRCQTGKVLRCIEWGPLHVQQTARVVDKNLRQLRRSCTLRASQAPTFARNAFLVEIAEQALSRKEGAAQDDRNRLADPRLILRLRPGHRHNFERLRKDEH